MSTRRIRRMKQRHDQPLTPAERYHLSTGIGGAYVDLDGEHRVRGFADESDAREAWEAHRDEFAPDPSPAVHSMWHVGERPWAWWRFESDRPDLAEGRWHPTAHGTGDLLRFDFEGPPADRFRHLAESGRLTEAEVLVCYEAERLADEGRWSDPDERHAKCWRSDILRAAGVPNPLEARGPSRRRGVGR